MYRTSVPSKRQNVTVKLGIFEVFSFLYYKGKFNALFKSWTNCIQLLRNSKLNKICKISKQIFLGEFTALENKTSEEQKKFLLFDKNFHTVIKDLAKLIWYFGQMCVNSVPSKA